MISRAPGQGRYAQVEREQRWVLAAVPPHATHPVEITDRYLTGTHLRVRQIVDGDEVVWKLGQKIRESPDSPEIVNITNIYLNATEYATLAQLEARVLTKTRWRISVAERSVAVDVFHGELDGLCLAEVELARDEEWLDAPENAVFDVTRDDRFSGGSLASLDGSRAKDLVRSVRDRAVT